MDLFTVPFVSRPASEARARREQHTGAFNDRVNMYLTMLLSARHLGLTWQVISEFTGEHHGKVSGTLSFLHKQGFVFQLREMTGRCHPYVHYTFREMFTDDQVYDEPAQTKAGVNRKAYEEFFLEVKTALAECQRNSHGPYSDEVFKKQIENFVVALQTKIQ